MTHAQMISRDPYLLIETLLKQEVEYTLTAAQEMVAEILGHHIEQNHRLHHSFFYEIRPLIKILEHIEGNSTILFSSLREEHDGEVRFDNQMIKVELTRAVDGENEALRMELLKLQGYVPAFQKIEASGRKRKRVFGKNELIARQTRCDSWYHDISDALIKAYEGKKNKKYAGHWLGITFDDWELQIENEKHFFNIPCNQFWEHISSQEKIFERVFVIGDSTKFIWDSWDGAQNTDYEIRKTSKS